MHRLFVALALLAVAGSSWGGCISLDTPALQAIDQMIDKSPEDAVRAAEEQLRRADGHGDPGIDAALYSIIAEARAGQSDVDRAMNAMADSRRSLNALAPSTASGRLDVRLQLLGATLSVLQSDSKAAVVAIDRVLQSLPENSLERACALVVRSQAYDYLNQPDRAVADALTAQRLAERGGWRYARMESAYTLARNFRRAGLFAESENMIDDVIAFATADEGTSLLSTAQYERGMLLTAMDRFADAQAALEASQALAATLDDAFGIAAANVPLCWAQINQGLLDAAEKTCASSVAALVSGQRLDLATLMVGYRARLDLARGRPAAALRKLDGILTPSLHTLLPAQEPQLLRDRARAHRRLQQYPAAYADVEQAFQLEQAGGVAQRNREVAVLSGILASESLGARNRLLEESLARQQQEMYAQQQSRRVWVVSTIAAATLCVMFLYLFVLTRRHAGALRRQESILRSAGDHAPDALLLLDENRLVRFANRALFGEGPCHALNEPFDPGHESGAGEVVTMTLDKVFATQKAGVASLIVPQGNGAERRFELSIVPAIDGHRLVGVAVRCIDVTDIRQLEREVIDGVNRERQRLSSDIHEGLGQELAGIVLLLGSIAARIKRGHTHTDRMIDQVAQQVAKSIETARSLARDLSPLHVGQGSLAIALEALARESADRLGVEVVLNCHLESVSLSESAADHLYRICREGINNAIVHGHCRWISVSVLVAADSLCMTIRDDGTGVSDPAGPTAGLGLKMVAYRVRLLGGTYTLRNQPEGGACLTITFPLMQIAASPGVPDRDVALEASPTVT